MGTFKISGLMLKSLFKKPATLMYPTVPREWEERTRGRIEIDSPLCILCGICSKRCPADAIRVDKPERIWEIDRMRCVQCNGCVEVCPKKCLHMDQRYTEPDTMKRVDTVSIPVPPPKDDEDKLPKEDTGEKSK